MPTFLDVRPIPGDARAAREKAQAADREKQQKQKLEAYARREAAAMLSAERARDELQKLLTLNAEKAARRAEADRDREAELEKQRKLALQKQQVEQSKAAAREALLKKQIETLNAQLARTGLAKQETEQSKRAALLAARHEQQAKNRLETDLARQVAARHKAEQALVKARATIEDLSRQLTELRSKATSLTDVPAPKPSPVIKPDNTQPTDNAIELARNKALAQARKRAKAARQRAKQATSRTKGLKTGTN